MLAMARTTEQTGAETGPSLRRLRMQIRGVVQGVGFRPHVYGLAHTHGLSGWVANTGGGLDIEIQGPVEALLDFVESLERNPPPLALIQDLRREWIPLDAEAGFHIRGSEQGGAPRTLILPDVAVCNDCLADIARVGDRRYRYPFTNCTNCGPRFSIIHSLPYDRPNTTMRGFTLCAHCRAEYEDPVDRRFHAQPVACPRCGPQLTLVARNDADPRWMAIASGDSALIAAAAAICRGQIVAVKGLGGFHLMADAADESVIRELRKRKAREAKPLAVMVLDLNAADSIVHLSDVERDALCSPAAPIVIAARRAEASISAAVAPDSTTLGVMLAYTPLHRLLLEAVNRAIVATSGNLKDEPICIDNEEAIERLGEIADLFLVHDRPIARHVDDSVLRVTDGAPAFLRRARGYAPGPVHLAGEAPPILAAGGHLKNVVALAVGHDALLSQHIGDLESVESMHAFQRVIADFLDMYDLSPRLLVHDMHPDYASTQWALEAARRGQGRIAAGTPLLAVQHHHAHLASCLADNGVADQTLGVTWDGSGYGPDGTIWGGECLLGDFRGYTRVAHLRAFRLPGGERAVREPRRCALALLTETLGSELAAQSCIDSGLLSPGDATLIGKVLQQRVNAPVTTSAGRLFDGLAALIGLVPRASFEGQAAMALESMAAAGEAGAYPVDIRQEAGGLVLDWKPMVVALLEDKRRGVALTVLSARIHRGLARAIVAVAERVGEPRVALSGGCFQNRLLSEWTAQALRAAGFQVLLHRRVPANDGGLCLGQIAIAAASLAGGIE